MPFLNRRRFATLCSQTALALVVPASNLSCSPGPSAPTSDPSFLIDKLQGMILLGTYGDALGALHEPAGLQGKVGNPDAARRLSPVRAYQPPGSTGAPWWIWLDGNDLSPDMRGVPTDDSAFRLLILHPWLQSLTSGTPDEARFRAWLQNQIQANTAPTGSWQERRAFQIRDWLTMLDDAQRWTETPPEYRAAFQITEGNPFFRPTIPIVFGLFMYLECAALYAHCDPGAVRTHFASFCSLDQGYAGEITGLFAALIASAVSQSAHDASFSDWYIATIRSMVHQQDVELEGTTLGIRIETAWRWGVARRGLRESAFLQSFKTDIYEALLPGTRDAAGFRVFDPLLFLQQITATVAYAADDLPKMLTLMASNPGDADTIPSMFGSLAGAWYGLEALNRLSPVLAGDLVHVRDTLGLLFDYDLEHTVHSLAELSQALTCP